MNKEKRIIAWNDRKIRYESLGGKAKNLALLSAHNLPVPPWYCIPSDYYHAFIFKHKDEITGLMQSIDGQSPQHIEQTSVKIKALLVTLEMESELRKQIDAIGENNQHASFAVRSSCSLEDSSQLSFAGLFDTYLNITPDKLYEYVHKCWLSLFNTGSLAYIIKHHISPFDLGMAVIIQAMVDSVKSGVLFQANPAGRLEEIAIVAGYGLGEGIVSDQVPCDTFYYNRGTKTYNSAINRKQFGLRFDKTAGYGIKKETVPDALQGVPVLSADEIAQLVKLSASLEKIYTTYQDIEWAFDAEGRLFLLQSRPITTIPEGEVSLYDNSNISENYPGLSSPLTISFVKNFYYHIFYTALHQAGFSRSYLKPYESYFASLVDNIEGRLYYNMTSWHQVMSVMPFASRLFIPVVEDSINAERSRVELNRTHFFLTRLYYKLKFICVFITRFLRVNRLMKWYDSNFAGLYQNVRAKLLSAQTVAELKALFADFYSSMFPIIQVGRTTDIYLMMCLSATNDFLKRQGMSDHDAKSLINGLLVGEEGLASVMPVKSIQEMANDVQQNSDLRQLLETSTDWIALQERLAAVHPAFLNRLLAHLDLYGDRTIGELKLETKGFRQQPLNLVQLIVKHAASTIASNNNEQEQLVRKQAEDTLDGLLPKRGLQNWLGYFLIKKLRMFIKIREKIRFNRLRCFGIVREIIIHIANNWVEEGVLTEADDIYYLTYEEVLESGGQYDAEALQQKIAERKDLWKNYKTRFPVNRMVLKGDIAKNQIPQVEELSHHSGDTNGRFKGIGCCPGIVSGDAIILFSPDETVDVKNKILVAQNTDPGWVFLIMSAKGLVIENGSLLSHTAIIGRELGIPTIVGVANATRRIQDNATIRMDGSSGLIEIVSQY